MKESSSGSIKRGRTVVASTLGALACRGEIEAAVILPDTITELGILADVLLVAVDLAHGLAGLVPAEVVGPAVSAAAAEGSGGVEGGALSLVPGAIPVAGLLENAASGITVNTAAAW